MQAEIKHLSVAAATPERPRSEQNHWREESIMAIERINPSNLGQPGGQEQVFNRWRCPASQHADSLFWARRP